MALTRATRRTTQWCVFVSLALLVSSCSRSTSSNSSTTIATTTTIAPANSLLALSDVGDTWKVGPAVTDAVLNDATQVPCKGITLDSALAARLRPTSGVQFEPIAQSYVFLSELVTVGDANQIAADLVSYLAVEQTCADTPNNGLLRFEEVDFPTLGDQRSAWVLSAYDTGSNTAVWHIRSAIVRVGGTLINVNLTEVLEKPNQALKVSDAEFERIVTAAVSKFE